MLAGEHRLRHRADFTEVLRAGRRAGRPHLTLHLLLADAAPDAAPDPDGHPRPPRAGLVVSKAVGGAVVRHRTARRLRHQLAPRLAAVPAGARLVVRAAPRAGQATSAALGADLDAALARLGVGR